MPSLNFTIRPLLHIGDVLAFSVCDLVAELPIECVIGDAAIRVIVVAVVVPRRSVELDAAAVRAGARHELLENGRT